MYRAQALAKVELVERQTKREAKIHVAEIQKREREEERLMRREMKARAKAVGKIQKQYEIEKKKLLKSCSIPNVDEPKKEILFRYSRSNPDKIRKLEVEKSDDIYVEGYEIEGEFKQYKKFFRQFMIDMEEPIYKAFIDLTI